jgi:hypothetical protein
MTVSNMSYCRFRNTLADLRDCKADLETLLSEEERPSLGEEELSAAQQLVETCIEITAMVAVEDSAFSLTDDLEALEAKAGAIIDDANCELEYAERARRG